jgi:stage IV sporulation protein FA
MNIKEYKKNKNKIKKENKHEFNYLKSLLYKTMISILLFLIFLIGIKKIEGFDDFIYKNIYVNNISFAKINSWYEKYFGNILPIKQVDEIQVFNEHIDYISFENYLDGVKLKVKDNYIVPILDDGIVVYIGNKKNYGRTIIIQRRDGLETWYSNVEIGNIELYDYVKKGDYIGEAIENNLILVFQKEGKIEDYKKYI